MKDREIYWVIKQWVKWNQFYMPDIYGESRDIWEDTPYAARKFQTEQEAELYLHESFDKKHWGGLFQIEKIYINR